MDNSISVDKRAMQIRLILLRNIPIDHHRLKSHVCNRRSAVRANNYSAVNIYDHDVDKVSVATKTVATGIFAIDKTFTCGFRLIQCTFRIEVKSSNWDAHVSAHIYEILTEERI